MEKITVKSVNTSAEKGTVKKPVKRVNILETGVENDAHAGDWNRQVSLLGLESIARFSVEAGRDINPGEFAENITTEGMALYEAHPLDRFVSGDLILEISQIGKKCHGTSCAIFKEVGNCVMPAEGIFCRVVSPGTLTAGDQLHYVPHRYRIYILTISDRASRGLYSDRSGPATADKISEFFYSVHQEFQITSEIIPDDPNEIRRKILDAVEMNADIIITTGGTGIGTKDFTPDVIRDLIDKEIPGIMDFIRLQYGAGNPKALISRSIAGVKERSLIYALPGSVNAVKEYLQEITKTIMHSVYMIHGLDLH